MIVMKQKYRLDGEPLPLWRRGDFMHFTLTFSPFKVIVFDISTTTETRWSSGPDSGRYASMCPMTIGASSRM